MNGLLDSIIRGGIMSYGARYAESPSEPLSMKGKGYFGELPAHDGFSTEISSTDQYGQHYPLLAPNLTEGQINQLLQGGDISPDIYKAAEDWANYRRSIGQSPFASPTELRIPTGLLGY